MVGNNPKHQRAIRGGLQAIYSINTIIMITDKELQEYYSDKNTKGMVFWRLRNLLDWAIISFVRYKPTFWESIFGISDKQKRLYQPVEEDYRVLIHFGLITSDRKKITAKGRQYYDQITSSNYVTPN